MASTSITVATDSNKELKYFPSKCIGLGNYGTRVFLGELHRLSPSRKDSTVINVAVKEMICQDSAKLAEADREVRALQTLQHTNVVTYHMYATKDCFVYIALDLCRGTLIDCIDKKQDIDGQPLLPKSQPLPGPSTSHNANGTIFDQQYLDWMFKKHLLQGIAAGLNYVHVECNINIIHRDLKPQNVLIKSDESNYYGLKAVISDFGFCRELAHGQTSVSASQTAVGTNGWMAKEQLTNGRISTATDIFAFGCIAHYVLSPSRNKSSIHPFGASEMRNEFIKKDKRICHLYYKVPKSFIFQGDLILSDIMIGLCVSAKRTLRPHANEILNSPFFWGYDKKMQLIEQIFNEYKDSFQIIEVIKELEQKWNELHPSEFSVLVPEIWKYYKSWRKNHRKPEPNPNILFNSLMRLIRNTRQHFTDAIQKDPALKDVLGSGDDIALGYYFFEKIPLLLPVVYVGFYHHAFLENKFQNIYDNLKLYLRAVSQDSSQSSIEDEIARVEATEDQLWMTLSKLCAHGNKKRR